MPDSVSDCNADTYEPGAATPAYNPDSSDRNVTPDPDLRQVVAAWPTLPESLRKGILAMVESLNRKDTP